MAHYSVCYQSTADGFIGRPKAGSSLADQCVIDALTFGKNAILKSLILNQDTEQVLRILESFNVYWSQKTEKT